jgi:hypothetical protein
MGAEPLICLGTSGSEYPPSSYSERYLPRGMNLRYNLLPDYRQFAAYCREWVEHFKDTGRPVKYYEIWNEPWGYFDWAGEHASRLDDWMDLWITCEREMHAEDPSILIGSDHATMKKILENFIWRNADLGFISYHKYDTGSTSTSDSSLFRSAETKNIDETSDSYGAKGAQERWLQVKGKLIPVMNTECNLNWDWSPTDSRLQKMSGAVWNALCLRKEILEGVRYHVYFDEYSYVDWYGRPNGFGMVGWSRPPKKWYPYHVYNWIGNNLAYGDIIIETTSSSENLRILGWIGEENLNILIIHKAGYVETARIEGVNGEFTYYKIDETYSYTSPQIQEGKIDASEDIMLNGYAVVLLKQKIITENGVFHDDFESGDFMAWSGTITTTDDHAQVTGLNPHFGSYGAVFVTFESNYETRRAYSYRNIDDSPVVYARGYFYVVDGLPLVDTDDRFTLLQFLGSNDNIICNLQIRRMYGEDRFCILAGEDLRSSISVFPVEDTWYCLELYVKIHSTEGVVKGYVDGDEILSLTNIDTASYGDVERLRFGLASSIGVQQPITVYGDCCMISNEYIGLLRPWDLNQDGVTDLRDMAIACRSYGISPLDPGWSEVADLDSNGAVDMKDVAIVARHFNEDYL